MAEGFIPPHGGYKRLLTYQRSEMIYDATVRFCERVFPPRDRTAIQMIQAARSGKQNILEGSMASGTSKESEIKLTNVARASLEELLEDYRDFLRLRGADEWSKDHPHSRRLTELLRKPDTNYETLKRGLEHENPVTAANLIAGLIRITNYLLDRQISRIEQDFLKEGGLRERMTRARLEERSRQTKGTSGTKE